MRKRLTVLFTCLLMILSFSVNVNAEKLPDLAEGDYLEEIKEGDEINICQGTINKNYGYIQAINGWKARLNYNYGTVNLISDGSMGTNYGVIYTSMNWTVTIELNANEIWNNSATIELNTGKITNSSGTIRVNEGSVISHGKVEVNRRNGEVTNQYVYTYKDFTGTVDKNYGTVHDIDGKTYYGVNLVIGENEESLNQVVADDTFVLSYNKPGYNLNYWTDQDGVQYQGGQSVKITRPMEFTGNFTCSHSSYKEHEANAATCIATGNIYYVVCDTCGQISSSSKFTDSLTEAATVTEINPDNHVNLIEHAAVKADCSNKGNIYYVECKDCGKISSDKTFSDSLKMDDVVTPINPDNHLRIGFVNSKKATCAHTGNIYYVECYNCGKKSSNTSFTDTFKDSDIIIPIDPYNHESELVKTDYNAPTYLAEGNIDYWYCASCEKYFSDEKGTKSLSLEETAIPKNPIPEYFTIIDGENQMFRHKSVNVLAFVCDGEFEYFDSVMVDGEVIDSAFYDAESGSTVITLHNDYLQELKVGMHELEVVYKIGETEVHSNRVAFQIRSERDNVPSTGDRRNVLLWTVVMMSSISMLAFAQSYTKKKYSE